MEELHSVERNQSPCNLSKIAPPIRPNGINTQKTAAVPKISEAI